MQVDYVIPTDSMFRPWVAEHSLVFLQTERKCRHCSEWWPLDLEFWGLSVGDNQGFTEDCKACLLEKQLWERRAVCRLGRRPRPVYVGEKPCTACKVVKPLSIEHFRAQAAYSDGFRAMCKLCENIKAQESIAFKRVNKEREKLGLPALPKPARKPRSPRKSRAKAVLPLSA
jgi:hypothetical protein